MDNYILAYYQEIKDGSVIVSKWVRTIYQIIVGSICTNINPMVYAPINQSIKFGIANLPIFRSFLPSRDPLHCKVEVSSSADCRMI